MAPLKVATSPAIFIAAPKYVAIKPNSGALPLKRISSAKEMNATTTTLTTTTLTDVPNYTTKTSEETAPPKTKKRRLDYLSWEEKIQRKKLKNRVAAQTSRDRKKARMEEMEYEIRDLTQTTEMLQEKCETLEAVNTSLMEKNQKLDAEVEQLRQQLIELKQQQQQQQQQKQLQLSKGSCDACVDCESIINGSAVSKYIDSPLQQGTLMTMDSKSTCKSPRSNQAATLASLWRIVALCLLYKSCSFSTSSMSKTSTAASLRNLPRAYSQISQQTLKLAILKATEMLPRLRAYRSNCLDKWWGPQQNAWNPTEIANATPAAVVA